MQLDRLCSKMLPSIMGSSRMVFVRLLIWIAEMCTWRGGDCGSAVAPFSQSTSDGRRFTMQLVRSEMVMSDWLEVDPGRESMVRY